MDAGGGVTDVPRVAGSRRTIIGNLALLPFPGAGAAPARCIFRELSKGLKATPADIERQTDLLGHAPRSFEDFAMETARIWKA